MDQHPKEDLCNSTSDDTSLNKNDMKTRDLESPCVEEYNVKNPSPTPEILEGGNAITGDAIGDTVFSERSVLQALMALTEVVSKKGKEHKSLEDDGDDDDEDDETIQELDKDIETQLCQLWDMTVTQDVVNFLLELPTLDLIADALTYTKMPRLTEIVVGIVGNMACVEVALKKLSEHPKIKSTILQLLDISDPPTLTEIFRLLLTCLQNKNHSTCWLKSCLDDEHFLPHLTFIMASSTNSPLLTTAVDFVDYVLDISDTLCNSWATSEFVDSLLEALRQVGFKNLKVVETFLHVLQLLSTSNKGKIALALHAEVVVKVSSLYLNCICKSESFNSLLKEEHVPQGSHCIDGVRGHEPGVASALLLLHILLLSSQHDIVIGKLIEENTLAHVLKLMQKLGKSHEVFKTKPESLQNDESDDESRILQEIVEGAVITLLEEILDNEKGNHLLVNTMGECTEDQCRDVLAWMKQLPGCHRCYCQLKDVISKQNDSCSRLADILQKLESSSTVCHDKLEMEKSASECC